jgi:dolichol-phosphate mannosyltransferase
LLLTLLVPCHNERDAVGPLLRDLARLPALLPPDTRLELVLVDDGSTDGTVAHLEQLLPAQPFPCRVLPLTPNRGIGAALRAAGATPLGDVVVTYDADRPYPIDDIPRLLARLDDGLDVVSGSPWHPDGGSRDLALHRRLLSQGISILYRLRLGRRARGLHTLTSGFRAWRRGTFLASLPTQDGFVSTAEMLVKAIRGGSRVGEVPSSLRARTEGTSKMRVLRTAWSHLGLLIRGG